MAVNIKDAPLRTLSHVIGHDVNGKGGRQPVSSLFTTPDFLIPTFATYALASAYAPKTAPNCIKLLGYNAYNDRGGASYYKVNSQPSHDGKLSITIQGGSTVWYELLETQVSPEMFGAKGDATDIGVGTDDTAAIEKWKTYLSLKIGTIGVLLSAYRYRPASPWVLSNLNQGYTILGREKNRDGFILDAGFTLSLVGANNFYHRFEHMKVLGNVAGPVMRIGKDDYSDAFNGSSFLLTVNNNSLSDSCEGLRVNYVLQTTFFCTVNCGGTGRPNDNPNAPGHGKALVIRHACFSQFIIAVGQANVGLYMTDGNSFSNTFLAIDIEEVSTAVKIDNASVANNIFVSGQILGNLSFDCTNGNYNTFHSGCNIVNYPGGSLGTNLTGIEIIRNAPRAHVAVTNPTMPASTVFFKNTTGEKRFIHIWAGNYSLVRIKAPDGGIVDYNPQVVGEGSDVILHPNWEISITYTSAPNWRWFNA